MKSDATRRQRESEKANAEAAAKILANREAYGGQGAIAVQWAEQWRQQHPETQEARGKT